MAAVVAKAPHPNAARLFINWVMSEDGARMLGVIPGRVERMLELVYRHDREPTIEQIQDTVEKAIAAE